MRAATDKYDPKLQEVNKIQFICLDGGGTSTEKVI